jgi:hypothetical protein
LIFLNYFIDLLADWGNVPLSFMLHHSGIVLCVEGTVACEHKIEDTTCAPHVYFLAIPPTTLHFRRLPLL